MNILDPNGTLADLIFVLDFRCGAVGAAWDGSDGIKGAQGQLPSRNL